MAFRMAGAIRKKSDSLSFCGIRRHPFLGSEVESFARFDEHLLLDNKQQQENDEKHLSQRSFDRVRKTNTGSKAVSYCFRVLTSVELGTFRLNYDLQLTLC